MKTVIAVVVLLTTLLTARAGDSVVTFRNDVFRLPDGSLDPARLVTFDASFGALAGQGVRNGVVQEGERSYVAQLFKVEGGNGIPVGTPVPFGGPNTTDAGTWKGGNLTLAGVEPGSRVELMVKVWDDRFSTFEAAAASPLRWPSTPGFGSSAVFSYTQPKFPLLPSDTFMTGFSWFSITIPVPEPRILMLLSVGLAGLLCIRRR